MKVILKEDVLNVGRIGDIVKVADGYARNYLLPRSLAVIATTRHLKQLEHEKRLIDVKKAKFIRDANDLKNKLDNFSCTFSRQASEDEKLFGSVTNKEIADALKDAGYEIDKRMVILDSPIKKLGVYTVDVKLHPEIIAKIKVWVVAE